MRINGRNWPVWVFAAATLWLVAITVFWGTRPLTDRVPTNVTAVAAPGEGPPPPGTRATGPTVEMSCGAPAESKITDERANAAELAALVDRSGLPLRDPRFDRQPCVGFHHQSRVLWFVDLGLYLVVLAALAAVLVRRRGHHHHPPPNFATAA